MSSLNVLESSAGETPYEEEKVKPSEAVTSPTCVLPNYPPFQGAPGQYGYPVLMPPKHVARHEPLPKESSLELLGYVGDDEERVPLSRAKIVIHVLVILASIVSFALVIISASSKWKYNISSSSSPWQFGYFYFRATSGRQYSYAYGSAVQSMMTSSFGLFVLGATFLGIFIVIFSLQTFSRRFRLNLAPVLCGLISAALLVASFMLLFGINGQLNKDQWCAAPNQGFTLFQVATCQLFAVSDAALGTARHWGPTSSWVLGVGGAWIMVLPAIVTFGLYVKRS